MQPVSAAALEEERNEAEEEEDEEDEDEEDEEEELDEEIEEVQGRIKDIEDEIRELERDVKRGVLGESEQHAARLEVERRIRGRVKKQMERSQKEYYLKEQMRAIQKELGERAD